jgi:hypothetical protein
VRGLEVSRPKRRLNRVADPPRIIEHGVVREAKKEITTRLQYHRSVDIPELGLFIVMNPTVDFDDQSGLDAHEIGDIALDGTWRRNLAPARRRPRTRAHRRASAAVCSRRKWRARAVERMPLQNYVLLLFSS